MWGLTACNHSHKHAHLCVCFSCVFVCFFERRLVNTSGLQSGEAVQSISSQWAGKSPVQREREGEKMQQERKTNAGRGSSNGCKSQQACKQTVLFRHHTRTPLIVDYHLTAAPCHPATGCAGLSVSQLEADWSSPCEWVGRRVKKKRDNLATAALMMPSSITEPGAINNHTPSFSCRRPH